MPPRGYKTVSLRNEDYAIAEELSQSLGNVSVATSTALLFLKRNFELFRQQNPASGEREENV